MNLHKRKILEDPSCPVCKQEPEIVCHALWTCSAAQDVWHGSLKKLQKSAMPELSFLDVVVGLFGRLDADGVDMFTSTARQIWLWWNKWVFEGVLSSPEQLTQRASDQVESAKAGNIGKHQLGGLTSQRSPTRWSLPPIGFVKSNWDVAVDSTGKRMGVGLVLWNHNGEVVAAMCSIRKYIIDGELVILEGDSLGVVQSLQGEESSWASVGQLLDDVKALLGGCLSWQVLHVRREANSAADKLAKFALQLNEEHQWRVSTPLCICDIVMAKKSLNVE